LARVSIAALVLAGGPADDLAARQPGAPNKAFVEIAGVSLVGRVVGALRAAPSVTKIVVVAPPAMSRHPGVAQADELRPAGPRITDSLRSGLAGFPSDEDLLVVASDLPVLTVAAIEDFVTGIRRLDADVVYGCVEKRTHLAAFPQFPHTWARLRDGTYCGGGIVTLKPRAFALLERFIERLGAARKHPGRLASLFGWDVLARYALGRLTIAQAESRASSILGAPVRALVSPYPETAINVDRVGDIALTEQLLQAKRATASA
jgi:molybdopterin-guanine dinucleotide biosynthesis protein A